MRKTQQFYIVGKSCYVYLHDMDKQTIIQTIKAEKPYLRKQFGVMEIALFGSFARGEQNPESDIDFLVKFEKPSYSWLVGLHDYLESKLKAKVDVISNGPHLTSRFLDIIKSELIYA